MEPKTTKEWIETLDPRIAAMNTIQYNRYAGFMDGTLKQNPYLDYDLVKELGIAYALKY